MNGSEQVVRDESQFEKENSLKCYIRFYFDRNSIRLVEYRFILYLYILFRCSFYLHPCEEIKLFP